MRFSTTNEIPFVQFVFLPEILLKLLINSLELNLSWKINESYLLTAMRSSCGTTERSWNASLGLAGAVYGASRPDHRMNSVAVAGASSVRRKGFGWVAVRKGWEELLRQSE